MKRVAHQTSQKTPPTGMRRWRLAATLLAALLLSSQAPDNPTDQQPRQLPERLVLPWKIHNVDARNRGLMQSHLPNLLQEWAGNTIGDAKAWAPTGIPLNRARLYRRMHAGKATDNFGPQPVAYQPIWCRFFDHDVVAVSVATTDPGQVLAVGIAVIPPAQREPLDKSADHQSYRRTLARALTTATDDAQTRAQTPTAPGHSLHVELVAGRPLTRADETAAECLNLLVARNIAQQAPLLTSTGDLFRMGAKDFTFGLKQQPSREQKPLRATRKLILDWFLDPADRTLPLSLNVKARWHEAVLGNPLAKLKPDDGDTFPVIFEAQNNRLQYQLPEKFTASLEGFRRTLQHDDLPQVSQVYRAWAYLDRGRAWGLKIGDRMVATEGGEEVKGHVVGFYGPHLGIKSPRGFAIAEGAILFVRKGQKQVANGMLFQFDPREFPYP